MRRSGGAARIDARVGLFVLLAVAASCAREQAPPGGPPDLSGPQVIATAPEPFAEVESFDGPVRITFNERISERGAAGALDQAVQISPESGEIKVRHGKNGLEVRMDGGFLPDLAYRVTVLPVVQDLFGNSMPRPFELVFSTGAEMLPSALAGMVFDRLTGQTVGGVRVTARHQPIVVGGVGEAQGPTYVAVTDTSGVFAFRYLPPVGRYVLVAFEDQNRNREADFFEPAGAGFQVINGPDTVFTDISLLRPDTTAAVISDVEATDSATVAVEFDDYLDPEAPLGDLSATLTRDSVSAGIVIEAILHERDYLKRVEALEDSLWLADSASVVESIRLADSLLAIGDSVGAAEVIESRPGQRPAPSVARRDDPTRDLPKRTVYLLLSDTLVAEETYEISLSGVINITGVRGGGGTAELVRPAPPVDSTAVGDSIQAADSAATVPDSIPDIIPQDTVAPGDPRADSVLPDAGPPGVDAFDTMPWGSRPTGTALRGPSATDTTKGALTATELPWDRPVARVSNRDMGGLDAARRAPRAAAASGKGAT